MNSQTNQSETVESPAIKEAFAKMMEDSIQYAVERIKKIDAALERHRQSRSLASHSWVVVSPDYWVVEYTFEPAGKGKRRTTGCELLPKPIEAAERFTEKDAKTLADDTFNGHGKKMLAMHWVDALAGERAAKLKLIEELRSTRAPN